MQVFDTERMHAVELAHGFQYPASLWTVIDELAVVADAPTFATAFPKGRQIKEHDVADLWNLWGTSDSLVPFFCESQPTHIDYYCCVRDGGRKTDHAVVVFADHAIVASWPTYQAFTKWFLETSNPKPK